MKKQKTEIKTEIIAGITTFFAMAYILVLNPQILGAAGMPIDALFTATALAAGIGCILMGVISNRPLAVASGMGINAYFAYTLVISLGITWQVALAIAFISSLFILLVAISNIDISRAVPESFKNSLIAALGIFLVFIGMQSMHFVVANPATLISLGDITSTATLVGILGFFLTAILVVKNVKGALFVGMMLTTLIAILIGFSNLPTEIFSLPPSPEPLFFKMDLSSALKLSMIPIIFALFLVTFFDCVGTNIALLTKAGYLKKDGQVSGFRQTLISDGLNGILSSIFGTSNQVTYLESASGIESGGRTGVTAIVVGVLFLCSLFFFPIIKSIPSEAVAPVVIIVGLLMLSSINKVTFLDSAETLSSLLMVVTIPLTYSISYGIAAGSITFVILKLVLGKNTDIQPAMYFIAFLSVLDLVGAI